MDIQKTPLYQLMGDRNASVYDIGICQMAISMGHKEYSGGLIADRVEGNEQMIEKIDGELKRRNMTFNTGDK